MSGLSWFVSIGYALLVCAALVAQDLRYAFVPAAVTILAFFLSGFIVFRRLRGAFAIPWPIASDEPTQAHVVIQGISLPFLGHEQELVITFKVERMLELAATATLAALTLIAILLERVSAEPLIHGFNLFVLELICLAGWAFLILSLRWLSERVFLPGSHVTVGQILSRDPGFVRAGITYEFFDDHHERRGGRAPLRSMGTDNAVLVFYNPRDPDRNSPQAAFRFHRFNVKLTPRQHKAAAGN
jgi:hypothetical protein